MTVIMYRIANSLLTIIFSFFLPSHFSRDVFYVLTHKLDGKIIILIIWTFYF